MCLSRKKAASLTLGGFSDKINRRYALVAQLYRAAAS